MRKFLKLFFLFIFPFILLGINYFLFFNISEGNLNRLGKINFNKEYREQFKNEFNKPKLFYEITPKLIEDSTLIDILTFGDSFSAQKNYGYQNYLASSSKLLIFNVNREYYPNGNQIQMIFSMLNGNMFEPMKVKYIVLQVVENRFVEKGMKIDYDEKIKSDYFDLNKTIWTKRKSSDLNLLKDVLRFSFYNLFYNFHNKGLLSPVYKMNLKNKLFTSRDQELFFFEDDIDNLENNKLLKINKLNYNLNILSDQLKEKNIKLIVLPAPDKYDLYQDFITDNSLPHNNFFDIFNKLEKRYIYINSKKIFENYLNNGKKDIYFADDTHWSPIGSKIIAKELAKIINKK